MRVKRKPEPEEGDHPLCFRDKSASCVAPTFPPLHRRCHLPSFISIFGSSTPTLSLRTTSFALFSYPRARRINQLSVERLCLSSEPSEPLDQVRLPLPLSESSKLSLSDRNIIAPENRVRTWLNSPGVTAELPGCYPAEALCGIKE